MERIRQLEALFYTCFTGLMICLILLVNNPPPEMLNIIIAILVVLFIVLVSSLYCLHKNKSLITPLSLPWWGKIGNSMIVLGLILWYFPSLAIPISLVGLVLLLYATHISENRHLTEIVSDSENKEDGVGDENRIS